MTKRITTSKRDREKAKQEKRIEKQKRKEERLEKGPDDNIYAYVDENGVLQSTPPDKPRKEVDASTIAVSISKQEDIEIDPIHNGIVDHFNDSKGYGFIKDTDSGEKYFFHISAAPPQITEGDKITFEIEKGLRGINAVRISIISK